MNEPIAGALLKLTGGGRILRNLSLRSRVLARHLPLLAKQHAPVLAKQSRALMALPERGRALIKLVPEPVQLELKKFSSRGAHFCREIFAGVLVVGLIVIVFGYGRLSRGPISLPTLVPPIEAAINGQLSDMHVKIDDAILQRSSDGPGVVFRLRNIRLIDENGSIVAQSPLAAIGLSGAALLSGKIAPGSVDFIGPKLILFYNDQGLALSFTRPALADADPKMRGSLGGDGKLADDSQSQAQQSTVAKQIDVSSPNVQGRKLNVSQTIGNVLDRARSGNSSYLTRFGVKDAVVVLDQAGAQTSLQVSDFTIDLEHHSQRSTLIGQANLTSPKGSWEVQFRTEQRARTNTLSVTAEIKDLIPSELPDNLPPMAPLRALDLPVSGEASVELSNAGNFVGGDLVLRLKGGKITPPWDPDNAMQVDGGNLHVRYLKGRDVVELAPSALHWGKSHATFGGELRPLRAKDGSIASWDFRLAAKDSVLAAEEFGLSPLAVDEWSAAGNASLSARRLDISRFIIRAGTASVTLAGSIVGAPGSPEVRLNGQLSPMPIDTLKQFWPKFIAGDARAWMGEHVRGGDVKGGTIAVSLPGGVLVRGQGGAELPPEAASLKLDFTGISIAYLAEMPPIAAPEGTLAISGSTFAVDIPEGKIVLPSSGEEIALHQGRFYIPDLRQKPAQGEITFAANGATPTVLRLLDHEPLGYMRAIGAKPDQYGGTASGSFRFDMPIKNDLNFKEIKLQSKARLEQMSAAAAVAGMNIEDGALDVEVNEQAVDTRGDVRIEGVPAKIAWQRLFYVPDDQQPPVKISAVLDEAARDRLGMKVNHLLRGPLPVVISLTQPKTGEPQAISMQADLTNAQLIFANMGWTKPKGRQASVSFDVVKAEDGGTNLDNLKILGDDIAINGTLSLDPNQHLKSFYFSDFSFDSQTHMEISAMVKDGNVLDVEAHGPTYDGKQFFQSLFSAGQLTEEAVPEPEDPMGIDLTARIGTVVGFYSATARDVQLSLKKRKGKLIALDAKGQLNGDEQLAVRLETSDNSRLIHAEARDAGDAFRLVGFYPSVNGGEAQLEVNLDASEAGTKSGTLWVRDFDVLGDTVVRDVLSDPNSVAAFGDHKQEIDRSRLAFNQLRAPFSVGNGKFQLKDAYVNGPMLGATMRGTVDFKAQTVDLGGTYVPLYGLNSALGAIPLLGKVLVGRQGEGVVGITFAIQGKLNDPAVLVNPISVMTPGIFRQIFEFGPTDESDSATPNDFFQNAH